MLLTNKQWAEEYAGEKIRIRVGGKDYLVRIIGYWSEISYNDWVVVAADILLPFSKYRLNFFGSDIIKTIDLWEEQEGYSVKIEWIIGPEQSNRNIIINQRPTQVYPHRCQFCKSPSRNSRSFIFCSNDKCKKSKSQIKALVKRSIISLPSSIWKAGSFKNAAGFVVCPVCGSGEIDIDAWLNVNDTSRIYCSSNHSWVYRWEIGDKRYVDNVDNGQHFVFNNNHLFDVGI